jgi:sec-independent protein translocase protein TatB
MFANVGWGEMLVLVVVGLVVLGPERLPGAIRWAATALRQARDYLSGVTNQLREDIGPEFDDLREPLSELHKLRGMTPRAMLTRHLLDGDESLLTGMFHGPPAGGPGQPNGAGQLNGPAQVATPPSSAASEPPAGGPAPFDTDAT